MGLGLMRRPGLRRPRQPSQRGWAGLGWPRLGTFRCAQGDGAGRSERAARLTLRHCPTRIASLLCPSLPPPSLPCTLSGPAPSHAPSPPLPRPLSPGTDMAAGRLRSFFGGRRLTDAQSAPSLPPLTPPSPPAPRAPTPSLYAAAAGSLPPPRHAGCPRPPSDYAGPDLAGPGRSPCRVRRAGWDLGRDGGLGCYVQLGKPGSVVPPPPPPPPPTRPFPHALSLSLSLSLYLASPPSTPTPKAAAGAAVHMLMVHTSTTRSGSNGRFRILKGIGRGSTGALSKRPVIGTRRHTSATDDVYGQTSERTS